jgi:hypothetical protein
MLCADDIIDRLESLVKKTLYFEELGAPPPRNGIPSDIQDVLRYQRGCLAQIAQVMNPLSTELNILNPTAVAELAPLLRRKGNIIDVFLNVMKEGRLPVTELTAGELQLFDTMALKVWGENVWRIRSDAII